MEDDNIEFDTGKVVKIIAMVIVIALVGYAAFKMVTYPLGTPTARAGAPQGPIEKLAGLPAGDIQEITIKSNGENYQPSPIRMKVDVPVELTTDPSIRGCTRDWYSPKLGLQGTATLGKNIQYFIPKIKGTYPFSCTMNMGKGTFIVE